jgi:hypothetical protein
VPAKAERRTLVGISSSFGRASLVVALAASAVVVPAIGPSPAYASTNPAANVAAVCPPATPGTAECLALRRMDVPQLATASVTPGFVPPGLGPAHLQSAYNLPGGNAGSGLTVAIVDAFDLPTAESDLAAYRTQFGLPACTTANGCFRKVQQTGTPTAVNTGWDLEIALDLDMVSATCPNCNILLVEASSTDTSSLGAAVDTAVALGAMAVSNSYGGPEYPTETLDDSHFNHPGVAITVASGDCGYVCAPQGSGYTKATEYPSASRYVVAVGGTSLHRDTSARGWTETAWGDGPPIPPNRPLGAGSGCSAYEAKPAWQTDPLCPSARTQADVSAVADPNTGVAVYRGGWGVFGGTSAAAPIIAAAYALAGPPVAGTYPASYPYADTADLNDVIGGSNVTLYTCTTAQLCNGEVGYDGPTGLGTPNGVAAFRGPRSTYHPLPPSRILDTRSGVGLTGKFSSHVSRTLQVTGHGGVPANATAVTGTLTVTQQTSLGFFYAGPVAMNNPTSSNLNFPVNDDRANAVTLALGAGGTLSITYAAPAFGPTAQVVFDITGYFTADSTGTRLFALTPARILDTRDGTGGLVGPFQSHVARTFQVWGNGGVPTNALAVTGNLTVTQQTAVGFLYVGPSAIDNPTTSTLNFPLNDDRANEVTVALSGSGTLSITYAAPALGPTANVVFDVTGYFVAGTSGSTYMPLNPYRLLDTRFGTGGLAGPFSSHVAQTFLVTGGSLPVGTTAVTGNLTVTQQTSLGFLDIGPVAANDPTSSTLNFPMNDDRANAVTVALAGDGTLSVTYAAPSLGPTAQVIFDISGYFAP